MKKDNVRNTMLSLAEHTLKHAKQNYADFLESAMVDSEDKALAERASDLAEAFDQPIHTNIEKLEKLKSIRLQLKN